MHAKSLQLCLTLCDPMDYSPPGSSVHGILQARIVEWVALPSSRGSSQDRGRTHISYVSCIDRRVLYNWCYLGSPRFLIYLSLSPSPFITMFVFYYFSKKPFEFREIQVLISVSQSVNRKSPSDIRILPSPYAKMPAFQFINL